MEGVGIGFRNPIISIFLMTSPETKKALFNHCDFQDAAHCKTGINKTELSFGDVLFFVMFEGGKEGRG